MFAIGNATHISSLLCTADNVYDTYKYYTLRRFRLQQFWYLIKNNPQRSAAIGFTALRYSQAPVIPMTGRPIYMAGRVYGAPSIYLGGAGSKPAISHLMPLGIEGRRWGAICCFQGAKALHGSLAMLLTGCPSHLLAGFEVNI